MANKQCEPNDALLRDNFAAQVVQASAFEIVIDIGKNDPVTNMPMVYIGDFDQFERGGTGAIQSTSPSSLEMISERVLAVEDLSTWNADKIQDPRVQEHLDEIRADLIGAVDRYTCATNDHMMDLLAEGWKADMGVKDPSNSFKFPENSPNH